MNHVILSQLEPNAITPMNREKTFKDFVDKYLQSEVVMVNSESYEHILNDDIKAKIIGIDVHDDFDMDDDHACVKIELDISSYIDYNKTRWTANVWNAETNQHNLTLPESRFYSNRETIYVGFDIIESEERWEKEKPFEKTDDTIVYCLFEYDKETDEKRLNRSSMEPITGGMPANFVVVPVSINSSEILARKNQK